MLAQMDDEGIERAFYYWGCWLMRRIILRLRRLIAQCMLRSVTSANLQATSTTCRAAQPWSFSTWGHNWEGYSKG